MGWRKVEGWDVGESGVHVEKEVTHTAHDLHGRKKETMILVMIICLIFLMIKKKKKQKPGIGSLRWS